MSALTALGLAAAVLAAVLHVVFFVLESVLFRRPAGRRLFGVRAEHDSPALRSFAINQGVYNLALAIVVLVGVVLLATAEPASPLAIGGLAVTIAGCSIMVVAGAALALIAPPRMLGAALAQALPPVLAIVLLLAAG